MNDFDMPILLSDIEHFKDKNMLFTDALKNDFLKYKNLVNMVKPKEQKKSAADLAQYALVIQSCFRGMMARREVAMRRKIADDSAIVELQKQNRALDGKGKVGEKKDEPVKKDKKGKGKLTEAERKKQADKQRRQQIQKGKEGAGLDKKMAGSIKAARDAKEKERLEREHLENTEYIKDTFIDMLITKAFCYGESLEVCRDIQTKYENRPVTKYIYPILDDFTFQTLGVSAKSLQPFNALGKVMFLNAQNQLQQFDVATKKNLPPVSLGTRPPLKHYNIIDMVVD